ncbi:MAG: carboxymuconolactone decarboxylase family protein [Pseudomonadales bacterium]
MTRLSEKNYQQLAPEQQSLFDEIVKTRKITPTGQIGGPFDPWLLNAEMGKRIVGLGGMFRFRSSVDRRYIELTILVTGQFWQAQFEWYAHEPMAIDAGVPQEVIDAIKVGATPAFEHEEDRITYELCNELHNNHQVSDKTYADALEQFGEQGICELINLAGYYTMVSMTLNTFKVALPDGATYPFPE